MVICRSNNFLYLVWLFYGFAKYKDNNWQRIDEQKKIALSYARINEINYCLFNNTLNTVVLVQYDAASTAKPIDYTKLDQFVMRKMDVKLK